MTTNYVSRRVRLGIDESAVAASALPLPAQEPAMLILARHCRIRANTKIVTSVNRSRTARPPAK